MLMLQMGIPNISIAWVKDNGFLANWTIEYTLAIYGIIVFFFII